MRLSPIQFFHAVRSPRIKRWMYYALLNSYLPHFGAGIRTTYVAPDLKTFRVAMPLRFWNRNFVGTQFGGSLYAMCDAPFMLILLEAMGDEFVIWDKAATIRFRRPGRGTVRAEFRVTDETIEEIRRALAGKEKHEITLGTTVTDERGEVVAEIDKVIHFRHKVSKLRTA